MSSKIPPAQPNREYVQEWVEAHGDRLYRFAMARVGNPSVSEDLVQITFLAAMTAKNAFQGRSSIETWLLGILKHKIMDHFRKAYKSCSIEDFPEIEKKFVSSFDEQGSWKKRPESLEITPEQVLSSSELRNTLWHCIQELPPKMKTLFIIREIDGENTASICEDMDLTVSNFGVIMHRARHKLRECFSRHGIHSLERS